MGSVNDRHRLLRALEALSEEATKNKDQYWRPLIAHANHVRHYFQAYREYLQEAGKFGVVSAEFVSSRVGNLDRLPVHRDNMGSLMAMVGELGALVRSSLEDFEREMEELRSENDSLKKELERCQEEVTSAKKST